MAGGEEIGHGYIKVDVQSDVAKDLSKIQAEVKREMEKIDGQKATLLLDANDNGLKRKIDSAEGKIDKLEAKKATVEIGGDTSKLEREIAAAKAELSTLKDKKVKIVADNKGFAQKFEKSLSDMERAQAQFDSAKKGRDRQLARDQLAAAQRSNAALQASDERLYAKLTELRNKAAQVQEKAAKKTADIQTASANKTAQAVAKAARDEAKAVEDAEKRKQAAIKKTEAQRNTIASSRDRLRAQRAAMVTELKDIRDHGRNLQGAEREANDARLADSYAFYRKLRTEERNLNSTLETLNADHYQAMSVDERAAHDASITELKKYTNDVGRENMKRVGRVSSALKSEQAVMQRDMENKAALAAQYAAQQRKLEKLQNRAKGTSALLMPEGEKRTLILDTAAAEENLGKLRTRLERIGEPPPHIEFDLDDDKGLQALAKISRAISDTSVRLGPFTTTIAGAGRALAVLGPIVNGVVGAAGALAGALGAGIGGGLGIVTAGVSGAIPLFAGFVATLVPVGKELGNAFKASSKLNDAILKNGKGSKEAKKAQEDYNSVLKNLPPQTRKAFDGITSLRSAWSKGTKETARNNIGTMMSDAVATANTLLPGFVGQVNRFSGNVTKGFSGWMRGLRSNQAKGVFDDLFSGINKGVRPAMAGLGNLGSAFGQVVASFTRSADNLNLGKRFQGWTKGISEGLKGLGEGGLDRITGNLTKNFLTVGKTVRSASDMLGTFFYKAANSGGGMKFLDDINKGMDKLTDKMAAGGMDDFLGQSIETTKNLAAALKPIGSIFAEWTTITAPLVNAVLQAVAPVLQLTAAFLKLGAVKGLITGLFAAFVVGKSINGLLLMATAVSRLRAALIGLTAVQAGTKGLSGLFNSISGGAINNVQRATKNRGVAAPVPLGGNPYAQDKAGAASRKALGLASKEAAVGEAALAGGLTRTARAGTVAAKGVKAVGSGVASIATLGATANPIVGGVALALAGVGVAAYLASKKNNAYKDSAAKADAASAQYAQTLQSLPGVHAQNLQATTDLASAQTSLASVQKQINAAQDAGNTKGAKWNDLLNQQATLQTNVNTGMATRKTAMANEVKSANTLISAAKTRATQAQKEAKQYSEANKQTGILTAGNKALGGSIKTTSANGAVFNKYQKDANQLYDAAKGKAHAAGMSVSDYADYLKSTGQISGKAGDQLNGYLKRMANAEKATKGLSEAERAHDTAMINAQRTYASLGTVTDRAAGSLLKLKGVSQAAFKATEMNRAFSDRDISQVSQTARKAISGGASESKVVKIIGDSKSAEEAIRRINALKMSDKNMRIITTGGPAAVAMVQKLSGTKLNPFDAKIVSHGGPEAIAVLNRLNGIKPAPKDVKIASSGGPQAVAMLTAITGKKIPPKDLKIVQKGGPEAAAVVSRLAGTKIPQKSLNIVAKGGDAAVSMIEAIAGKTVPPKLVKIAAQGGEQAQAVLSAIQGKTLTAKQLQIIASGGPEALAQLNAITTQKINPITVTTKVEPPKTNLFATGFTPPPLVIPATVKKVDVPATVPPIKVPLTAGKLAPPALGAIKPLTVPFKAGKIEAPKANVKPVTVPFKAGKISVPKVKASAITVPVKVSKFSIPKAKAQTVTIPVRAGKSPSIRAPKAPSVTVKVKAGPTPSIKAPRAPAAVTIKATDGTGSAVSSANSKLGSIKAPPAAKISATWSGGGAVGQANSALGSVAPSVTRTITTRYVTVGSPASSRAAGGGSSTRVIKVPRKARSKASGGSQFDRPRGMASPPNMAKIDRAAETASLSAPRTIRGGRVSTPRYLVGEEGQSEYVIATNPRYRKRNQQYLVQAMNTIGLPSDGASRVASSIRRKFTGEDDTKKSIVRQVKRGPQKNDPNPPTTSAAIGSGGFGSGSDKGFTADTTAPRASKIKPPFAHKGRKRGTTKQIKANDAAWSGRIKGLISRQTDLEREVSIRESQVKEPTDWVVPGTPIISKDPKTGEIFRTDTWVENMRDINPYIAGMKSQIEAQTALRQVIGQLVTDLPNARAAAANRQASQERSYANNKAKRDSLKHRLSKTSGKTKEGKKRQENLKKQIDEAEKEMASNKEAADKARASKNEYASTRKEEGFKYREETINLNDSNQELAETQNRSANNLDANQANRESSESPTSLGGGNDGGGGNGPGGNGPGGNGGTEPDSRDVDARSVGDKAVDNLNAEKSLAGIGQGLNGQAPRSIEEINNDLINAYRAKIVEDQKKLVDVFDSGTGIRPDVSNDQEAINDISGSADAIKNLQDEIKQSKVDAENTARNNISNYNGARDALVQMATNMLSTGPTALSALGGFSGISSANNAATSKGLFSGPGIGGASINGKTPAPQTINKTINNTNNFTQQPDPHTWSRGVVFELNAAV